MHRKKYLFYWNLFQCRRNIVFTYKYNADYEKYPVDAIVNIQILYTSSMSSNKFSRESRSGHLGLARTYYKSFNIYTISCHFHSDITQRGCRGDMQYRIDFFTLDIFCGLFVLCIVLEKNHLLLIPNLIWHGCW